MKSHALFLINVREVDLKISELKTMEFQLYDDTHHNSHGIRFDFEEQGDHPLI